MRKTLAIDFDGTICKYQPFGDGIIYQEPNEGAADIIQKLKDNGWKIIIFTCRAREEWRDKDGIHYGISSIFDWCRKFDIPFDEITAEKPIATAYIDDRAIRFTNWQDIKNYFI